MAELWGSLHYAFFEDIEIIAAEIRHRNLGVDQRKAVDINLLNRFITFRQRFISLVRGASKELGNQIQERVDGLQGGLSNSIFNMDADYSESTPFDNAFVNPISTCRSDMLGALFDYRG